MDSSSETTTAEKPLYDTDFFRWSQVQAEAIRAAAPVRINTPQPIDWENVAEEIEDLGKSVRRELYSRVRVIIERLLKLSASPTLEPRRGWAETILEHRAEIEQLLDENPSLRGSVQDATRRGTVGAKKLISRAARIHGESLTCPLDDLSFTPEQVLEDWFPAEP